MTTKREVIRVAEQTLATFAEIGKGVWRTIRGRRVFIREGETPSMAVGRSLREMGRKRAGAAPGGTGPGHEFRVGQRVMIGGERATVVGLHISSQMKEPMYDVRYAGSRGVFRVGADKVKKPSSVAKQLSKGRRGELRQP